MNRLFRVKGIVEAMHVGEEDYMFDTAHTERDTLDRLAAKYPSLFAAGPGINKKTSKIGRKYRWSNSKIDKLQGWGRFHD